jgi:Protein of unknown function (DUF4058)
MAIHLPENQYSGVNAHFHSYLQQHNDWSIFHGEHISDLRRALQNLLPPESGYFAVSEKSLQIIRDDLATGRLSSSRTIPDIGVYKTSDWGGVMTVPSTNPAAPGATVPIIDTLSEPENVTSVLIYRQNNEEIDVIGTPVTRIELLSPANKPPGSHYRQYIAKRDETLQSGINLIEIDYLHEQRSAIGILPNYPQHDPHSYPYVILVNIPYPSLSDGQTSIFGFRVDDPIPVISVPLFGDDRVSLDLNHVYNQTFASNLVYGLRIVDYEKLPEHFESYDDEDQQRIQRRMNTVAQAQKKGN